jgi:hypothetical protein
MSQQEYTDSNAPPDQRPARQRGREFATFGLAFAIAFLVGRGILSLLTPPAAILQALLYLGLYVLAYAAIWRLSGFLWTGRPIRR